MSLDKILQQCMRTVPECVGAGYVDMSTGLLLAASTANKLPQEVLDLLAAATADLFQGSNTVAVEQMVKQMRRANDTRHYFQEIIVLSDHQQHVFIRCKRNVDHAVVYITSRNPNMGMVIARARMTISTLEDAVWKS